MKTEDDRSSANPSSNTSRSRADVFHQDLPDTGPERRQQDMLIVVIINNKSTAESSVLAYSSVMLCIFAKLYSGAVLRNTLVPLSE